MIKKLKCLADLILYKSSYLLPSSQVIIVLFVSANITLPSASAVEIVRLQLEYGDGEVGNGVVNPIIDLELFDVETPNTVTNFLNYVMSNRYDLTFFNRSVANFIIQTGGVTNILADPLNDTLGGGFFAVPEFPPVANEPGISNVRGTIAMAKRSGLPDSATSEWFINIGENSSNLDNQNGGFTVFGRVVDDGMTAVDEIASLPIETSLPNFILDGALVELPIVPPNPAGSLLLQKNIVMVLTARQITRPLLNISPENGNLGISQIGANDVTSIVFNNTGNEALEMISIDTTLLQAPFTIGVESCIGTVISPVSATPLSSCFIDVVFSPASFGDFSSSFSVNYKDDVSGELFAVTYEVFGEGVPSTSRIAVDTSLEVGFNIIGNSPTQNILTVENTGLTALTINSISGLGLTNFSQVNNCTGIGVSITSGGSCEITVDYSATVKGDVTATMTLVTNDPNNLTVDVLLNGYGSIGPDNDIDGALDADELAGPNQGDGNIDDVTDDLQKNVATIQTLTGEYITIVSNDLDIANSVGLDLSTTLSEVFVENDIPAGFPEGTQFNFGANGLNITLPDGAAGQPVRVAFFLPANIVEQRYLKFGPTEDDVTPHWYDFNFDPVTQTGLSFRGKTSIQSPANVIATRYVILLNLVDGKRGDDDLTANGVINISLGGIVDEIVVPSTSNSGAANWLVYILFIMFAVRVGYRIKLHQL